MSARGACATVAVALVAMLLLTLPSGHAAGAGAAQDAAGPGDTEEYRVFAAAGAGAHVRDAGVGDDDDDDDDDAGQLFPGSCKADRLRVTSYNIRAGHYVGPRPAENPVNQSLVLSTLNPHFVGLQEVDEDTQRDLHRNLAEMYGGVTHMHSHFCEAVPYQGGRYGIAVLSRFPILERRQLNYTHYSEKDPEKRVACAVRVQLPSQYNGVFENKENNFWFVTTHMSTPGHGCASCVTEAMLDQARQLLGWIRGDLNADEDNFMFVGDLNSTPDTKLHETFVHELKVKDLWEEDCSYKQDPGYTFPANDPFARIDFMYVPHKFPFKAIDMHIPMVQTSDHRPLTAVLQLDDDDDDDSGKTSKAAMAVSVTLAVLGFVAIVVSLVYARKVRAAAAAGNYNEMGGRT